MTAARGAKHTAYDSHATQPTVPGDQHVAAHDSSRGGANAHSLFFCPTREMDVIGSFTTQARRRASIIPWWTVKPTDGRIFRTAAQARASPSPRAQSALRPIRGAKERPPGDGYAEYDTRTNSNSPISSIEVEVDTEELVDSMVQTLNKTTPLSLCTPPGLFEDLCFRNVLHFVSMLRRGLCAFSRLYCA